ncbi:MAG: adenylate/guanylate cyclase domain-containing protein, partial [Rhodothermales bacterium]|nr:adenylate/guanylate cyclase domain-containing protein [Rhodothermales bacterium]
EYHGSVHQLLGDGFLAVFGAPISKGNDVRNAVAAALAVVERTEAACAAGVLPPTRVSLGLHAGEVIAGTVGSKIHKEYKVTGDVVNVAARVEEATRRFDARVLVTEAVRAELEEGLDAEPLGPVAVRGRSEPVRLYRLA